MSLLLVSKKRDFTSLKNALLEKDPNLDVEIWPRVENKERVNFAVCWNHPENVLGNYPNLRAVSSLGAGVNHLLNDESLNKDVSICRLITDSLKDQMADYVLNAVTSYRLNIPTYVDRKRVGKWEQLRSIPKKKVTVGIMGLGEMGIPTAQTLVKNGYQVTGWSRSKKEIEGVTTYAGEDGLSDFLSATNALVCLLPLTTETEEILDLELFKQLKKPAYLINVGRGQQLVEEDVIYALETEDLSGAWLDVFQDEPLPNNHIFWNRSKIMITPHIAAVTPASQAADILVENYKRALSGMELIYEVDREKGY
ncbi:2-hydroxyacid dehydrogenase [Gracilimonas mengyeensis]|uniref:Glyoxylate/hydroxypyruvate reductase A n=1 Tax=Gracilimonas mengyeensis TaxID=1302730 RepID=A0A521FLP7_9BACT|nr:glyoxylate/hydroxypyruvate reductase A [Gracilimonas mengyeensis]SMO96510.1 glyoxylate/hydroxypyruvate reductase A [Gracilimonas mengyeensis]